MKYIYLNFLLILYALIISSCFCSSRQRKTSSRPKNDSSSKSVDITQNETLRKEVKQDEVREVIKEITEFREVSKVIEIIDPARKTITTSTFPQITIERSEEELKENKKEENNDQCRNTEEELNKTKETNVEHEERNYTFSDDDMNENINEAIKKKTPKIRSLCIKIKRICDPCLGEESMCTCNSEDCINRRRLNRRSVSKDRGSQINTLYKEKELIRSSKTPSTVQRDVVVYKEKSRADEGIYSDGEDEDDVAPSTVNTERMRAMRLRRICNTKKLLILLVTLFLGYLVFFFFTIFPVSTAFVTSGIANASHTNQRFSNTTLYSVSAPNELLNMSALTKWEPYEPLNTKSSRRRRAIHDKLIKKREIEEKLKRGTVELKQAKAAQSKVPNNKNQKEQQSTISYLSNAYSQTCLTHDANDLQTKKESSIKNRKKAIDEPIYNNKKKNNKKKKKKRELLSHTDLNQLNDNKKITRRKKNTCPDLKKRYDHSSYKNNEEKNFPPKKEEVPKEVEKEGKLEKSQEERDMQKKLTEILHEKQKFFDNKRSHDKKKIEIYIETNEPKILQFIQNDDIINSLTKEGNVYINETEPNSKNVSSTKIFIILSKLPSEIRTNNSLTA